MENKIVVTSGYYIWLHVGHIECFQRARNLGDELVVILNNDEQQRLKYGKVIVPEMQRQSILNELRSVGACIVSIDKDKSVCKTLESIHTTYIKHNPLNKEMIFAKGGDRFSGEIPEKEVCDRLGIKIVDGLGDKIQSSSELLKNASI